eukprot:TRINITY_DN20843_c0_g1_i2.p1 TRINITY_DN20843_c0_g1~~TRINITY_DN20843_c0_g1_i2.p1  ORF type:complete len:209 (-),score=28.40 TRINITY_DN20843_c0_g1_i2:189-815(-)
MVIIGVHLKAYPTKPDACHQREGQATVIRKLVKSALEAGKHVVVLGDFNDFDPDLRIPQGEKPTSSVLRMIKDVDGDGISELWNVAEAVPYSERYSNWHDKDRDRRYDTSNEKSMIDHILISQSLKPFVESAGILHEHDPTKISDHWPIWVSLNLTSWADGHADPARSSQSALSSGSRVDMSFVCNMLLTFFGVVCLTRLLKVIARKS